MSDHSDLQRSNCRTPPSSGAREAEKSKLLGRSRGRVSVWRTSAQAYERDCLLTTAKHRGGSVMIWEAMLWFSAGPIVTEERQQGAFAVEAYFSNSRLVVAAQRVLVVLRLIGNSF
ncbi:hypothetical protein TNCV_2936321 [Trichonephila clavipes]|nr:hypothetical protein TNCV_2936321 [Trichonephila clavipes]